MGDLLLSHYARPHTKFLTLPGREVSRPEVATEIYLGALLAVELDTDAERAYFRALAQALKLSPDVVARLHRMTGTPAA